MHASAARKPDGRRIKRFHLHTQVQRPPHTARRGHFFDAGAARPGADGPRRPASTVVPDHRASTYVLDFLIAFAGAAAVYGYWVANRRRIAAETVGRAEEQAVRILRDAEREADTRRKEALLEAKERAHELRVEAEQ